jgi:hypothetical protein
MENFWNLSFQLMKHGTNTLHVAFIFVFSIHEVSYMFIMYGSLKVESKHVMVFRYSVNIILWINWVLSFPLAVATALSVSRPHPDVQIVYHGITMVKMSAMATSWDESRASTFRLASQLLYKLMSPVQLNTKSYVSSCIYTTLSLMIHKVKEGQYSRESWVMCNSLTAAKRRK